MAREITEVWGVFNADGDLLGLGEIRTEAILASDFGCDDDTQDALYEGSNGPHNGVTVERLPLLTPHDAAVLEEAETVDRETVVALREAVHRLWDHDEYADIRATMTHAANYMMAMLDVTRARRAANAGGVG
jgi:hypothetical protein